MDLGCGHLSAWPPGPQLSGPRPVRLPVGRGRWARRLRGPGAAPPPPPWPWSPPALPASAVGSCRAAPLWAVEGSAPGPRVRRTAARCPRPCSFEVRPGQHCSSLLGPGHSPGGGAAPSLRLPEAGGPAGRSGLGVEASGPELGDPEPPGEGAAPSTAGWGRSSPMGQLRGPKAVPGDRVQSGHWTLGRLHQCAGGRVCVGVGLCPCVLGRGKLSCVCRITCGGRGQEPSVTIGRERD